MIVKVLLDINNYVVAYASVGGMGGAIEVELSDELFDHFETNFKSYCCDNGHLVFNELKDKLDKEEQVKSQLRIRRENECFPIINRGKLWYDLLTSSEVSELTQWYQDWLDVTKTLIPPERPFWIKSYD